MKRFGREILDQALTLLAEVLARHNQPPYRFANIADRL